MIEKNSFYVTTPIYYVTAKPHLGSLYSTLIADVVARWNSIKGKRVFFLTGTDEHGQKVAQAAAKAGKAPQEFVDSFIAAYKHVWNQYELAYTYFIRTTDSEHVNAVQQWIRLLRDRGDIYKGFYKGWYCTPCETFVTEKEELDGSAPLCTSCGRGTSMLEEETYFFRLSAYQEKLLKFFAENPNFIIPKERAHEVINFVKEGLKDLSISRTTVTWGIPFPDDAHHITYVWADALNNYITAIGWGQKGKEKEFATYWPADVHVLGKDIVRFHAVYWPAFLMASGLPLPKHLLVHGWIKVNQQKMSKSFGNVIDPQDLYAAYGADPVRYYLMRYMAITQDGEFSITDLEQKIGSDLADALGNLLNRMVSLAHKYTIIDVPPVHVWSDKSLTLRDASLNAVSEYESYMDDYLFHMALGQAWKFIHLTNAYFHELEPWKIAKADRAQFMEILSATCHSLKTIAVLLWPVMPHKMDQLLMSIGMPAVKDNNTLEKLELTIWSSHFMLHKIPNLFEKPEQKEQPTQETQPAAQTPAVPAVPEIGIEDVVKVQLVVGGIESAESIPGSDKLLKLQVDFGDFGKRQILSGVKKSYAPEDLIGKQGVFVLNLKPRKMMGFESHGMMLFAVTSDRQTAVTVLSSVPNGTKVQ
jgi:methionyl-tRNA synthetase